MALELIEQNPTLGGVTSVNRFNKSILSESQSLCWCSLQFERRCVFSSSSVICFEYICTYPFSSVCIMILVYPSKRCQEDQQCSLMTKSPTSVTMLVCPTPGTWLTRWFSSSFSGIEWVIWCLDFMWDIHVTQKYPGTFVRSFWNVLSCLPMRMLCDIIPACLSGMPSPFLVSKSRAWWAYRWMWEGRYDAQIKETPICNRV